ncbi:MAG: hypothetical protein J5689_00560 [Clostridia bacterium]|nr:hypothetical protein [Clostridia bacterium]
MKKSTVLIIFIVYVASIVLIGFFGMTVKVYDEIKYVKSIQMSVEAEDDDMFTFTYDGIDDYTKNPKYTLVVNFSTKAISGTFLNELNEYETKNYLPLTFIPKVTYDTGDVAGNAEAIKYTISNEKLVESGKIVLEQNGTMMCFKSGVAFYVYVNPVSMSGSGTGANIHVFVL